jgi:large subunit ribosomal protein L21
MYAVIRTGGKQYKVEKGERLEVERVAGDDGDVVELHPVLLVDGETVLATPRELSGASVKAKVVGEARGPKIDGFTYKPKSNNRRRYGHRQHLSVIEITGITKGRSRSRAASGGAAEDAITGDVPAEHAAAKHAAAEHAAAEHAAEEA